MNDYEIEQFVLKYGRDILRFCRMTAGETDAGDELYQDTMLKLAEKKKILRSDQNTRSYALSISLFLWKNKRRKYEIREKLVPLDSIEALEEDGWQFTRDNYGSSPEQELLNRHEVQEVRGVVAALPEKYRLPIHLFYSADMQISEISQVLHIPEGTVKTRLRKAKKLLKRELEALGYDR